MDFKTPAISNVVNNIQINRIVENGRFYLVFNFEIIYFYASLKYIVNELSNDVILNKTVLKYFKLLTYLLFIRFKLYFSFCLLLKICSLVGVSVFPIYLFFTSLLRDLCIYKADIDLIIFHNLYIIFSYS